MKNVLLILLFLLSLLTTSCLDNKKKYTLEELAKSIPDTVTPISTVSTQQQIPQELFGTWIITQMRDWEKNKTGYEDINCAKDHGYKNLYENENYQVVFRQDGTCRVRRLNTTYSIFGSDIVLANETRFKIIEITHDRLKYEESYYFGSSREYTLIRDSIIQDSIALTTSDDDYLDDDFPYELLFLL